MSIERRTDKEIMIPPEGIIREGKALIKVETHYQTAMIVQKPRDIDKVLKAVAKECQFGGERFYYGWTLKRGKSIGKKIEGGSIGLATALARIWGNVATPITVEETEDYWMFTATFIDLETGFNNERLFRCDRTGDLPGEYDDSRKEDMKFQIGQSKAKRNVTLSSLPVWLVDGAVKLAKQAVMKKISKEGLAVASKRIVEFFVEKGITEKQLIDYVGEPKADWTAEVIAHLQGIQQGIEDEQITIQEFLQDIMEKQRQEPINVEGILGGKEKKAQEPAQEPKAEAEKKVLETEVVYCQNPGCKAVVLPAGAEESRKEFDGKVFCLDCRVLMRKLTKKEDFKSPRFKCEDCGGVVSVAEKDYSQEKYNKVLCFKCQKKHPPLA